MHLQLLIVIIATALFVDAVPNGYYSNSQSNEVQQNFRNQNNNVISQQMRLLDDQYNMMKEQTKSDYRNGNLSPQQYRDEMNAHRVDFQQRKEQISTSAQRAGYGTYSNLAV